MDFDDIFARFGALPGQVPDVEDDEPLCHRLVRSQVLENPELLALYRSQGLPVDANVVSDVFVLEPERSSRPEIRHAVLFEAGIFSADGLWLSRIERTVTVAWKIDDVFSPLRLEIFELQTGAVAALEFRPPENAGRVRFIARPDVFAVRAQLHVRSSGNESVLFGERLFLS